MNLPKEQARSLERLRMVLDAPEGLYRELSPTRADNLEGYLAGAAGREDEELLTEPILGQVLERVLGFPRDGYFPQLGRSGLKPDFTPVDLVAHRYVLDAKSSTQQLAAHEPQIRAYINQRRLDYGVLFNLRELRVYRRGEQGHDPNLSFPILPLWKLARGEAMPAAELGRFLAFCERFAHSELGLTEKVDLIRRAERWAQLQTAGEELRVDLDYLVDRLRELSRRLAQDAGAQYEALQRSLALTPGRERALLDELRLLTLDIEPSTKLDDLPQSVEGFRAGDGVAARAWRQYLLRVSQLALTRILLYRSWEDAGFVDERLYDGGFGEVYDQLGQNLQRVLAEAFNRGHERYRWLYGADNNYDWYRPRDEALVDVLYALVPVPLGKLDADVLGGLYESYVDEIDRDRLGQFYTPRAVVRFMLDRAGFNGVQNVFRVEADSRRPKRVLDFATGSGGFLVEAARRIIDVVAGDDSRGLDEGLASLVRGLHGCEISPFPYYLTEVNLLLQVSRLLGAMRLQGQEPGTFALGVVHADTLTLRCAVDESIAGFDPASRADRAELMRDERFGLVPLDREKLEAFTDMREGEGFDLVVGNPPYVAESGNKVLFDRLRQLPAWAPIYRGKSDYLYYFLWLAAEKVAPGGRLAVIAPAGWMNAGNADWLREGLAGVLRLDELFLFGSYRLFAPDRARRGDRRRAPTPTVESAILIATKAPAPTGHELRVVALEDEVKAAVALSGDSSARVPDRDALLAEMTRRAAGRAGRARGIHVHRVRQSRLRAAEPWPIKHSARDVAARVVVHLDAQLASDDGSVEPLGRRWHIVRGIETGADAYTAKIQRRLAPEILQRLEADGAQTGDPILELPAGSERRLPWRDHPEVLAHALEPRAILYGAVDPDDYTNLLWVGRDDSPPESVVSALERWRPVLATRAEFVRNKKRRWWETAWPRDRAALQGPKVISLHRTDRGRFALDEAGEWQPSNKATICTAREDDLSVAYLCGLLNSELLDLWYSLRGRTPWHVRRDYEPKPMARIPYRHVAAVDPVATDRFQRLREALEARASSEAAELTGEIGAALDPGANDAAEAMAALEALVRGLAANRRELLPHRAVATDLGRVVKDPWRTEPVAVEVAALIERLPGAAAISVRLDPTLSVSTHTDGPIGSPSRDGTTLTFRRARQTTFQVDGPPRRLDLLEQLVRPHAKLLPAQLESMLLPADLDDFERASADRLDTVRTLLDEGRVLVEAAERLVCRLYSLPRELEDAVVAHAAGRASKGRPVPDE